VLDLLHYLWVEKFATQSQSPWRPLRIPLFRNLLIADLVSDIGTFMQSVGAAWLMTSLTTSPMYIALIQTASALPFFVLALPAGSIGDIFDRRKLILRTELWMLGIAIVLAATTITHTMTPWLLLLLTFGLSAGDAIEAPTWRAIFPELVPKEDLPPALALNGIEFNLARAVGLGLAGLIIAVAGVGTAFVLNALSFLGVIAVIARWKRPARKSQLPAETLSGATIAALRYVRYSPDIQKLLFRSACLIFFSSAFWALLPAVARGLTESSLGYGLLLGFFGVGAVIGAVVLQRAQQIVGRVGCCWSDSGVRRCNSCACDLTPIAVALLSDSVWRRSVDGVHVHVQHAGAESCTGLGEGAGAGDLPFRVSGKRCTGQHTVGFCSGTYERKHSAAVFGHWHCRLPGACRCCAIARGKGFAGGMEPLGKAVDGYATGT
jgi:MFS family permease